MCESCKDRIKSHLQGRIEDLTKLWNLYKKDPDKSDEELGNFLEFGLCFDYVAPGTFNNQRRGFFRYQLSTGGPGDEFRFFCDEDFCPVRIEYWFLDWFDGAKIVLTEKREALLQEIFEDFRECGTVEAEYKKAYE